MLWEIEIGGENEVLESQEFGRTISRRRRWVTIIMVIQVGLVPGWIFSISALIEGFLLH